MSDATTSFAIPPAQEQTAVANDDLLTSASAGVIVERTAQLKNGFHSEGRQFARGLAELINTKMQGTATVFVYEETFGIKDKMHFLIHLSSLAAYEVMVAMGSKDEEYRAQLSPEEKEEATRWDKIFVDGGLQEVVLLPQFWGMYGTKVDGKKEKRHRRSTRTRSRSSESPARASRSPCRSSRSCTPETPGSSCTARLSSSTTTAPRVGSSPARWRSRSTRTCPARPQCSSTRRRSAAQTGCTG